MCLFTVSTNTARVAPGQGRRESEVTAAGPGRPEVSRVLNRKWPMRTFWKQAQERGNWESQGRSGPGLPLSWGHGCLEGAVDGADEWPGRPRPSTSASLTRLAWLTSRQCMPRGAQTKPLRCVHRQATGRHHHQLPGSPPQKVLCGHQRGITGHLSQPRTPRPEGAALCKSSHLHSHQRAPVIAIHTTLRGPHRGSPRTRQRFSWGRLLIRLKEHTETVGAPAEGLPRTDISITPEGHTECTSLHGGPGREAASCHRRSSSVYHGQALPLPWGQQLTRQAEPPPHRAGLPVQFHTCAQDPARPRRHRAT